MEKKDLYFILNLDRTCTVEEITKSYHKLALQWHPDKCKLPNANEHFFDILNAYKILKDPIKRKQYDSLNYSQKIELYDNLKIFFKSKIPEIEQYINIFFDNELQLKTYIDDMNLLGIYNKINQKIQSLDLVEIFSSPTMKLSDIQTNDINSSILATFEERYNNKYRKVKVNRKTKGEKIFYIPLRQSEITFYGEGEQDINTKKHGDLKIHIDLAEYPDFVENQNDIYYTREITIHEYLYGGEFTIIYFDHKPFHITFQSFIESYPVLSFNNKGMPKKNTNTMERGTLHIIFKIKDLETLKTNIKKICEQ